MVGCCYFPQIKVGKNILGKIYGRSILTRGVMGTIPGLPSRAENSPGAGRRLNYWALATD